MSILKVLKAEWSLDWSMPTAPHYPLLDWEELPEANWPAGYTEEKERL